MKDIHPALHKLKHTTNLPSMPQVLVELIDICNVNEIDLQKAAAVVAKDASLSAKVLQLVNSAFIGSKRKYTDIHQAVIYLGAEVVKNLAISVSVQQVFRRVETNTLLSLDRFWYHSFHNGLIAQNIAREIDFPSPSDAYLSGLLHDIGKLLLWMAFPGKYAPLLLKGVRCHNGRLAFLEKEKLAIDHCEAGAWLCRQWHLPTTIADSIEYHHHPIDEVAQALPLTKILSFSDMLSHAEKVDKELVNTAERLLNLTAPQLTRISENVVAQLDGVAKQLGIRIPSSSSLSMIKEKDSEEVHKTVSQGLINRVRDISQLSGPLEELLLAENQDQVMRIIEQGVKILFNEDTCIFFTWADDTRKVLQAAVSVDTPLAGSVDAFSFSASANGSSLLHRAVAESKLLHTFQDDTEHSPRLNLLDRQLLSLLGKDAYIVIPLVFKNLLHGLIVIGVDGELRDELRSQYASLNILARHAAIPLHILSERKRHTEELLEESIKAVSLVARKVGHEINNPVAILRNYVEIIRMKLNDGEEVESELQTMDDELVRIATLTEQLGDISARRQAATTENLNINDVVAEAVSLCKTGLGSSPDISISFIPDQTITPFPLPADAIRQIIINLVKNGIEALTEAGNITLRSEINTENEIILTVKDNGPGIASAMQQDIFSPGFSTKNQGHSGLGLAIVKKLIQDLQGRIICHSDDHGTTFSITIPVNNR